MALTSSPAYPIVGDSVTLSATASYGAVAGMRATFVPDDSALETVVLSGPGTDEFGSALDADDLVSSYAPDVAGRYDFTVLEAVESAGSPAHPRDAAGTIYRRLVATQAGSIYVGQLVDLRIATSDTDTMSLRIQINNSTVRAASLTDFGSALALAVSEQTDVVAALAALVGVTVAAIGDEIHTLTNDLVDTYEAHRIDSKGTPDVHVDPDNTNVVLLGPASDATGAVRLLNEVRTRYVKHCIDSSTAPTNWHLVNLDDLENVPVVPEAKTIADAFALLTDLRWRCYNYHRLANDDTSVDPQVHKEADTTNTLGVAITPLETLVLAVLRGMAGDSTLAAQRGENLGELDARTRYGFVRSS